jgi:hypothetical protein
VHESFVQFVFEKFVLPFQFNKMCLNCHSKCKRFNLSKPEIEMKGWTANWWISTFGNMNTHTMTTLPTNRSNEIPMNQKE